MNRYQVTASYFEQNYPTDNFVISTMVVVAWSRAHAIRKIKRSLRYLRLAREVMVHHAKRADKYSRDSVA